MPIINKNINEVRHKDERDEVYTLYEDIAAELPKYIDQLKDKRIICPCDWDESFDEKIVYKSEEFIEAANPTLFNNGGTVKEIDFKKTNLNNVSLIKCNFVKFLITHAEEYKIKSISVSGYNPNLDKGVKFQDIDYSKYDLVITNPPFSQFIEFINLMFENKKQFLVIGPQLAIGYKDIFKFIKANKMWLGYNYHLTGFIKADGTILNKNDSLPRCCCWFTNLKVSYRNDIQILTETYSPEKNPKFVNYDAILVHKSKRVPCDYEGEMCVPLTFLQIYNPKQFELIGSTLELANPIANYVEADAEYSKGGPAFYLKVGPKKYKRHFLSIVVKNKKVVKDDD